MLSDWLANLQLLAGRAGRAQPWWDASATTGEGGSACGVAAMGVPLLGSDHPARVHPGFKRYLDDLLGAIRVGLGLLVVRLAVLGRDITHPYKAASARGSARV